MTSQGDRYNLPTMCVCVCVRVTDVYTMCFGEFPDICNRCERNKEIAQNAQRQDVEIGGGILQHCARVVQNHRVALTFGFASCSFDFSAWHYWAGRFRLGCACRFTCGRQQPLHIYIYYIIILYIYIYIRLLLSPTSWPTKKKTSHEIEFDKNLVQRMQR